MDSVVINAPAKINLFLKVLAKRPDGYHTIETLFEKIALFDRIKLQKSPGKICVYSDKKGLPKDRKNLAYRAAELMRDRYGKETGVKIKIEKSIPIGAGLGGGSSDAAAVLIGIDRLYGLGISREDLLSFARELGADVSFFLSNESWAIGRERGDKIEDLAIKMRLWHILVIPPFYIPSKEAYQWIDKGDLKRGADINEIMGALKKRDIKLMGSKLYNELEGLTFEKEDSLKGLKDRLVEFGAMGASVSGSGPCLFGIAENKKEVMRLRSRLSDEVLARHRDWQVIIAPTL